MTPNNNLSILPFYTSIDKQDHRKSYAYGEMFPIISSTRKLPPFQINREHLSNTQVSTLKVHNLKTGTELDILSDAVNAGLTTKFFSSEGYDLIINPSKLMLVDVVLEPGFYYLELSDGANTWFSDVFNAVNDLSSYLKIEYWDQDNLGYTGGHIDYSDGFKFFVYLATELGRPEYTFEEEVDSRDGYDFVEKQISEKKYKFKFVAPEYLCDALRVVRMHDYIKIYSKGETYSVESIIFDPKWTDQGNAAIVETEFECDTVVKKIAKGLTSTSTSGDFSDDFSDDFNN